MKHSSDKKNIVIASVLKPVNDSRMFEKIGLSLSSLQHYNIHIIGQNINEKKNYPNISFYPIFSFRRLQLARLFAPLRYFMVLLKLKPKVIIVCTHELLIVTVAYKIIFGTKIIYDIQENYKANILYTNAFLPILKNIIAYYVLFKETVTSSFISHFILAERCFVNELIFIKKKYTILENKVLLNKFLLNLPKKHQINLDKQLKLVYSGTIDISYGILEAIRFAKEMQKINKNTTLDIIGYCSSNQLLMNLNKEIGLSSFITLTGGYKLVPHEDVLSKMNEADIVVAPYRINKSTKDRIPTKIYECISLKTIILTSRNEQWDQLISYHNAGICIDFNNANYMEILNALSHNSFYKTKLEKEEDIYFDTKTLVNLVYNVLI